MKEILESIILNIVDNRESVSIDEKIDGENVIYEVKVANGDMGRVIGKQGRTAKAIRTLMKSLGAKEKKRISIECID